MLAWCWQDSGVTQLWWVVLAQGSSGEQRLWCEPVAAGRTPRREREQLRDTSRGVISCYSGAPDILVYLVFWCIKPDLHQRYSLKVRPRDGREQQRGRQICHLTTKTWYPGAFGVDGAPDDQICTKVMSDPATGE